MIGLRTRGNSDDHTDQDNGFVFDNPEIRWIDLVLIGRDEHQGPNRGPFPKISRAEFLPLGVVDLDVLERGLVAADWSNVTLPNADLFEFDVVLADLGYGEE